MSAGIPSQVVEILLREGIDSKTNAKTVMPGKLLALENGTFTEGVTIKKRLGYVALARDVLGADPIAAGQALATLERELLLLDAGTIFSWSPGLSKWADRGDFSPVTVRAEHLVRGGAEQITPDSDTAAGITVSAWEDSRGGVWAMAVDSESGAVILGETELDGSGMLPKVICIQSSALVVYFRGTDVRCCVLDLEDPSAFGASQLLRNDAAVASPDRHLAVCDSAYPEGTGDGVGGAAFAYHGNVGNLVIGYVRADGTIGSPINGGWPNPVSIAGEPALIALELVLQADTGALWAILSDNAAVRYVKVADDLTTVLGPADVDPTLFILNVTAVHVEADDAIRVFYEETSANPYDHRIYSATIDATSGAVTMHGVLRRSVGIGGSAFQYGGFEYVIGVHDSGVAIPVYSDGLQNTYFVIRDDGLIVARMQPGTAGRLQSDAISRVREIDDGVFSWTMPVRTQFRTRPDDDSDDVITYSPQGLATGTITFASSYRSAQIGSSLLLAGGIMGSYDGQSVVEQGFLLYPENVTAAVAGAGGSLEAGNRQAVVVWEWMDRKGNIHQSAPSPAVEFTTVANDEVTFTIPTLRLTEKTADRVDVVARLFMTEADGDVFYDTPQDGETDPNANPVFNDPSVDSVTFTVTISDTERRANRILYTQGGALPNIQPPSGTLLAVTKNRVFVAGLEERRRIFYSKAFAADVGVSFTDTFYFDVDDRGGEITAIEALDQKLVIFKETRIEVVHGDGPDDTGAGGTFLQPEGITVDVGCTNPASVAVFPGGLVFQSAKGIYAITRGLEARYVGAPVEAYNDRTITSATLVEDKNQVRFTTDSGITLVWDYFFDQWSTFTFGAVDALVHDGVYTRLSEDGKALKETADVYKDDGEDVHLVIELGWIKRALQGWWRVRRILFLGDYLTPHTFRARLFFDYKDFYEEQRTWTPEEVLSGTVFGDPEDLPFGDPEGEEFGGESDPVNQWGLHLAKQKCQAIRLRMEDTGSNPGAAFSLAGLLFLVADLGGQFRLPSRKMLT